MKPRLIARLATQAAIEEARIREDITRLSASLADTANQRETLGTYRTRLTQSWTNGAAQTAATAQRAEVFCAAARIADAQITSREQHTKTELTAALTILANLQTRSKKLAEYQLQNQRDEENSAELRREKDRVMWAKL